MQQLVLMLVLVLVLIMMNPFLYYYILYKYFIY
jgi:hypothetical protein